MTHLILSREYPPAAYPPGGIGTYVSHITRLLAEAGETVHVIGQRWEGAPERVTESCGGKLIVHRVSLDEPLFPDAGDDLAQNDILRLLAQSSCPSQLFSWQAGKYAEALIEREPIELVEGQEWEAPLYYLQARRAAGLGPMRQPPCLVHLHSPSRMIFHHNEWDETLTDFLPLCRFEEYSIRSADALVCPSRFLAREVTELFDLETDQVDVIPYAMGVETPILERSPETWAQDRICYVGRLELRKGVVEWVDAAVRVASIQASVAFDFYGSDTYLGSGAGKSVLESLKARIPRSLRHRFQFHGSRSRADLLQALAGVSVAVVPSRWENLPFTCIEAMSTGLPVLASPNGGMAELVEDGRSGWVAPSADATGLEAALLRVLGTSAAQREAMGRCAAETVRRICSNDRIVASHIALRERIVLNGAKRSRFVAGRIGCVAETARRGLGIVVTCIENPERIEGCLESIARQSAAVRTVLVLDERLRGQTMGSVDAAAQAANIPLLYCAEQSVEAAQQLGMKELLAAAPNLRSVAMIDQDARLEPSYATACESIFDNQPQVGLVSPWILRKGKRSDIDPGPGPVSLNEFGGIELPRCSAIRVEILLKTAPEAPLIWATLATGNWSAFTYPGPLVSLLPPRGSSDHRRLKRRYSGMALIQSRSAHFTLRWFWSASLPEKIRWLTRMGRQPQRVSQWIGWQLRGVFSGSHTGGAK